MLKQKIAYPVPFHQLEDEPGKRMRMPWNRYLRRSVSRLGYKWMHGQRLPGRHRSKQVLSVATGLVTLHRVPMSDCMAGPFFGHYRTSKPGSRNKLEKFF
jgi:hypothetical protein